jgi:hypothetical protein
MSSYDKYIIHTKKLMVVLLYGLVDNASLVIRMLIIPDALHPSMNYTSIIRYILTCPYAHNTISPTLRQITILNPDPLNNSRCSAFLRGSDTRPTVPMPPIRPVIHFHHVLPSGRHNPPAIEHHACDRKIISISVVNSSCPEIPDLQIVSDDFGIT